jgi:hypothetical protein
MPPEQRAAIERLSPQQKAVVEKVVRFAPNLKKVVIGLVVFIIAVQALPALIALVWN